MAENTPRRRVTDEELLESYRRLGSVHKVEPELGISHATAHRRLTKLGVTKHVNVFTEAELDRLHREYRIYRDQARLGELAASMGREVTTLCTKAKAEGLTDPKAPKLYAQWKYLTEDAARTLLDAFKASSLTVGQFCKKHGYDHESFSARLRDYFPDEWEHVIEAKMPRQMMYRRGREFEYRVRDHLKAHGYFVLRSPASKSPIDLVAIRPGEVLFVQCKRGGSLGPGEWNRLWELAESCCALPILAETPWPRTYRFWRLTARKNGDRTQRQPMVTFEVGAK
jgi:Holliday junction resolvase